MADQEKDWIRTQFGNNAENYRDEVLFAAGADLVEMVRAVDLRGAERVLDLGSGAGHTALAFAPRVAECIGCDLTQEMVAVAEGLARQRGTRNVSFEVGDAEALRFSDEAFDVVTCRFAAHHFVDVAQALREVTRVLKPNGTFLLVDHYAPEDPVKDAFVNELDRLRDPSHVRESRLSEYRTWFHQAGLSYQEVSTWDLPIAFDNWVERAQTPMVRREHLVEKLQEAGPNLKETFRIVLGSNGKPESFCLKCALLKGIKLA